jgi:hypothetical protein
MVSSSQTSFLATQNLPDLKMKCLPLPRTSAHVDLQILDGGSFTANDSRVVEGAKDREHCVPDWAFFVKDHDSGRQLLWDYGLSEVFHL